MGKRRTKKTPRRKKSCAQRRKPSSIKSKRRSKRKQPRSWGGTYRQLAKEFHVANLDERSKSHVTVNDNVIVLDRDAMPISQRFPQGKYVYSAASILTGKQLTTITSVSVQPATSTWYLSCPAIAQHHALPTGRSIQGTYVHLRR